MAFIDASNNQRIKQIYNNIALWSNWIRHIISYKELSRRASRLEEHKSICSAIKEKNSIKALERLSTHLDRVELEYLKLFKSKSDW